MGDEQGYNGWKNMHDGNRTLSKVLGRKEAAETEAALAGAVAHLEDVYEQLEVAFDDSWDVRRLALIINDLSDLAGRLA